MTRRQGILLASEMPVPIPRSRTVISWEFQHHHEFLSWPSSYTVHAQHNFSELTTTVEGHESKHQVKTYIDTLTWLCARGAQGLCFLIPDHSSSKKSSLSKEGQGDSHSPSFLALVLRGTLKGCNRFQVLYNYPFLPSLKREYTAVLQSLNKC